MGFIGLIFAPFILFGLLSIIGAIIGTFAALILLTLILTIVGLALRKKHKKASNVLLLIALGFLCLLIFVLFIILLLSGWSFSRSIGIA